MSAIGRSARSTWRPRPYDTITVSEAALDFLNASRWFGIVTMLQKLIIYLQLSKSILKIFARHERIEWSFDEWKVEDMSEVFRD